ncbi:uroporphyrinogen-III C-methyltransferase [Deefgea salmonis]|uniref:Uroporphyrinogen-III C-methyltransferase n=1 Tax=Deefgea salmonis TaxID=2875502 RepID=A0ABS8BPJ2_9NEIS|nr:uroporphyrinogen-III C-methyltransferase [Deefgea salmonis]MCB5197476.1 uroporphyrinogen-III C-methyltransferase [Deefgea salmonis]
MNQDNPNTFSAALNATPRRIVPQPALILAIVAILASAGAWLYQQNAMESLKLELSRELASNNQLQQALRQSSLESSQTQQKIISRLDIQENKQAEAGARQEALNHMYDNLSRGETLHSLAEVEQMLSFASQQLQIAGDINSALTALNNIDVQLAQLNRPELINVRQALTKDINTLKGTPYLDVIGITAKLNSIIDSIDSLPLIVDAGHNNAPTRYQANTQHNSAQRFGAEIWHELKQLIQIRRIDQPDLVLLSPEQGFFLRENIKLRLLNARAALLLRNESAFRSDLKATERYLQQFFDARAPATDNAIKVLRQLQMQPLAITMPDLSASLTAVRAARTTAERAKP